MDKGIICRRDLIYTNPLGGLEPWDRLGLGKTRGLGRFAATGAPWKWVLNLEGTRLAPILGIAGAAAGKKTSFIYQQGNRIWRHRVTITTCNPKGYFSMALFQSKDTFSHCFFLSSVNNSLAPHPQPRQLCPGVCGAEKFSCSSFPRKQHQSHSSSLRFLSVPTTQRKHPKHFAPGFMAVLLFLNRGEKRLGGIYK